MLELTTPIYSFVRFDGDRFALLVNSNDTVAFQVRANVTTTASDWFVRLRRSDNLLTTIAAATIVIDGNDIMTVSVPVGVVVLGYSYTIELVYAPSDVVTNVFVSNRFVASNVESNVVKYRHFEDHLEFDYTNAAFYHQVRLPIHLHSYKPATELERYQRTNGEVVNFGSFINDTWAVDVDWQNADFHRCMQAMWLHRNVLVTIESVEKSIQTLDAYELTHSEDAYFGKARGLTRVSAA